VVLGNPQVLQHHHTYHLQVPHLSINQLKPPGDPPIHQSIKTSRAPIHQSIKTFI
jgi:hypothetical protein